MKLKQIVCLVILLLLMILGCAAPQPEPAEQSQDDADVGRLALRLAQESLIVDTHVDLPYRLKSKMEDISVATEGGDIDYPRAVEGGLNAPFMSIYVPSSLEDEGAYELANELIDMVEGFERDHPDKFAVARSSQEVEAQFKAGLISLPLGIENGAPIEGDLTKLKHFFDRGVRYITLAHAENNHICDSSYADDKEWDGLSPFGRELVVEMNRLGVMVDVSHLSDASIEQVLELSAVPVIASHSSLRHFTPGWERNLSDELVRGVAAGGGVVQINFGSTFLTEAANVQSLKYWKAWDAFVKEGGFADDAPEVEAFVEEYWSDRTRIYADVSDVVAHIQRVVELAGIDHVGLGSDFDGVGDSLPTGLKDASQYPNLIEALLRAEFSEEDVVKVLSGNLMRVWREVEAQAAGS